MNERNRNLVENQSNPGFALIDLNYGQQLFFSLLFKSLSRSLSCLVTQRSMRNVLCDVTVAYVTTQVTAALLVHKS